jgi:hypothetical protein
MDVIVDLQKLRERAWAFARRMYSDDDPRQAKCAARFEHEEYLRQTTPPFSSADERIERLLIEIRDLLKSKAWPTSREIKMRRKRTVIVASILAIGFVEALIGAHFLLGYIAGIGMGMTAAAEWPRPEKAG